jgi:pilus assembly protein Flp/PilA
MMNLLKRLYRDEEGQAMAEYALILALVAVVVISTLTTFGTKLSEFFTYLTSMVTDTVTE